jgi:hypothetical protein
MKTKMYFFLAKMMIKLTYVFDTWKIQCNAYRKICTIRAIAHSNAPASYKIEEMKKVA